MNSAKTEPIADDWDDLDAQASRRVSVTPQSQRSLLCEVKHLRTGVKLQVRGTVQDSEITRKSESYLTQATRYLGMKQPPKCQFNTP